MNSVAYTDGVVKIYEATNKSIDGGMPEEELTLKETLRYKERTVGNQRLYLALQAGVRVTYVLRCPRRRNVSSQDIAVPNDGKQYRISRVQYPEDVAPASMDLELEGGDGRK